MSMKTPEQIAQQVIENFDADNQTPEGERAGFGILAEEDLVTWMIDAINADREQFFDTAGSASRQHYIDTGRYMLHEEVAEMERINGR